MLVRGYRTGLGDNHTTTDLILFNTTQQQTYVVTSFATFQNLAEHFNTGYRGFQFFIAHTDDFNGVARVDNTGFDTAGSNSTTTGNQEHVFDRHQEILLNIALGQRNPFVNSSHQFHHLFFPLRLAVQGTQSGPADDRSIVSIVFVERKQFTDFHFNEVEQLGVVHQVNLVHENNDTGHTYLTSQQDVFTCLGHRTIGSSYYQDSTIHLSSTGNHVLNIVGVTRAVYVSIVTGFGLVFNVSGIDGNTTFFFFRSVIDRIERFYFGQTLLSENGCDSGGQGGLAVVNVTDGTNVYVGFGTHKSFFCHI